MEDQDKIKKKKKFLRSFSKRILSQRKEISLELCFKLLSRASCFLVAELFHRLGPEKLLFDDVGDLVGIK